MVEPGKNQVDMCLVCGNIVEPAAGYCVCCGFPADVSGLEQAGVSGTAPPADAESSIGEFLDVNCCLDEKDQQEAEDYINEQNGKGGNGQGASVPHKLVMVVEYHAEEEGLKESGPQGPIALIGAAVGPNPIARLFFVLLMLVSLFCGYMVGSKLWAVEDRKVIYLPHFNINLKRLWSEEKAASPAKKVTAHNSDLSRPAPRLIDRVIVPRAGAESGQEGEESYSSDAGLDSEVLNNGKKQLLAGETSKTVTDASNDNTKQQPASVNAQNYKKKPAAPAVTARDILLLKQAVASAQKNYLLSLSTGGENAAQAEKIYRQNTVRLGHALYSFYTSGGRNNPEIARQEMRLLMVELWGWGTPGVEQEIERGVSTVR